jgi:cell division protein FtsI (penicillin-binding protein 3)
VQIQGLEASAWAAEAEAGRMKQATLPAVRGSILDAEGVALATTVEARDVTVDQTMVEDPAATAELLAPYVDLPVEDVEAALTGDRRFAFVAKAIVPERWKRIEELKIPGVYSQVSMRRVYPAGPLAANVVGFVGADGRGLGGLEHSLDDELAGEDGLATFEVGAGGRHIAVAGGTEESAVDGADVTLTIDRDIQYAAQRAIAKQVRASNAESGTVVVTDPRTGEILALAVAPSFNPNKAGSADSDDLGNRALSEVYEPGSTSKVMTMAAALEEGAVNPRTHVVVPPSLKRGVHAFHDSEEHGTLHLTATGVLAKSSNLGTMLTAEKIGREKLVEYLEKFGIGEPSGLGALGESRGVLPDLDTWSPETFATVAFGQGLSVNSIQATQVFSTIANDGVRVEPSLISSRTLSDGTVVEADAPEEHEVISAETASTLRTMMESVVADGGTAPLADIPGYRVAGKTGTANRVDPTTGRYSGYTSSFIGMAPADDPQLVVSVTLQNPRNGHYGGVVAGPVFKNVMSFALQSLRIPPTGERPRPYPLVAR